MIFITLKLIVIKNISQFFNFAVFCFFFVYLLPSPSWSGPISTLGKYKLFCLVSVSSEAILTLLISFLFKKNGHKVVDVINVCRYCYLILSFVLTCFLNNG